jgi:hypothetical protein
MCVAFSFLVSVGLTLKLSRANKGYSAALLAIISTTIMHEQVTESLKNIYHKYFTQIKSITMQSKLQSTALECTYVLGPKNLHPDKI